MSAGMAPAVPAGATNDATTARRTRLTYMPLLHPESGSVPFSGGSLFYCATVQSSSGANLVLICPDSEVSMGHHGASSWRKSAFDRLSALGSLRPNWDSYGAAPVSIHAITKAARLLHWLADREAPAPQIVATADGGVQIEWHVKNADVELDITAKGVATIDVEDLATGELTSSPVEQDALALRSALSRLAQ